MTKKRKRLPTVEEKLQRPWCYYCERDFDDLKILISHQKAKHFKCERCGRRLNTAGGLSVHMSQVHKETLSHVENAIPGRQTLEVEIFGMEGVPEDIIEAHNKEVKTKHYAEEAERQARTGNPSRSTLEKGEAPKHKRARVHETLEEIQKHAAKYRQDRINGVIPPPKPVEPKPKKETPPAVQPFDAPPQFPAGDAYPLPPGVPPSYPPVHPGSVPGDNLPVRAGFDYSSGGVPSNGVTQAAIDDLIKDVSEKKTRRDKNIRLVFYDDHLSPEEKTAMLPRYARFARA